MLFLAGCAHKSKCACGSDMAKCTACKDSAKASEHACDDCKK